MREITEEDFKSCNWDSTYYFLEILNGRMELQDAIDGIRSLIGSKYDSRWIDLSDKPERYLAFYNEHYVENIKDFPTYKEAFDFLVEGGELGYIFEIMIVDKLDGTIMWKNDFLDEEEIKEIYEKRLNRIL